MNKTSVKRNGLYSNILEQLKQNPVTVVSGYNRSYNLANFLLDNGFNKITTTSKYGKVVIFKKYGLFKQQEIPDGIRAIRDLNNSTSSENEVLIIEDCQDASAYIEVIIAWLKLKKEGNWKCKILLLSPNQDVHGVAEFMNASVIHASEKNYPVTVITRKNRELVNTICQFANEGKNVLAILPSKRDIYEKMEIIKAKTKDIKILALYSDMSLEEQKQVTYECKNKVILATNVAQTAAIRDIDVVVDCGTERHIEIIDGFPTLTIGAISTVDHLQRKKCAGFSPNGTYVWCSDTPIDSLRDFPIPEIYTGHLDSILLHLAFIGIDDVSKVKFIHQPSIEQIRKAQHTLRVFEAFDKNNEITDIGYEMARIPVAIRYSRMLVKAKELGVLNDAITLVAIQQVGGIKLPGTKYSNFTTEKYCDMVAELQCFNTVSRKLKNDDPTAFEGINQRAYHRIVYDFRSKLEDVLSEVYFKEAFSSTGNLEDIRKVCAISLIDHLYKRIENNWYISSDSCDTKRKIDSESVILPGPYVLGIPKNIPTKSSYDGNLYIISSAMWIRDISFLENIAPHLIDEKTEYVYDYKNQDYQIITHRFFNGLEISSSTVPLRDETIKSELLADWLTNATIDPYFENCDSKIQSMLLQNNNHFRNASKEEIKRFYEERLHSFPKTPNIHKKKNIDLLLANPKHIVNPKIAACF